MFQTILKIKNWRNFLEFKNLSEILDQNGFILFFKKNGKIYAAKEEDRLIFAKLKNNDTDDPMFPNFKKDAVFSAIDLKNVSKNPNAKSESFNYKDIKNIKVCDKEEAMRSINHE
jgi:hypothetical protein